MKNRTSDRRAVMKGIVAGAVGASAALPMPAIAQSMPEVKWRLASSFPKSLKVMHGAIAAFSQRVSEATDQKFQIRVFPAGELVPPLQVLDTVQAGTVEAGFTALQYYVGKNLAFGFYTGLPFGMNTRQTHAWMLHGNGTALMNELLGQFNITGFSAGNTGAQMGGWFRKEVRGLEDFKGLKYRVGGLGGQVLARLGVVPQQVAPGDIFAALEKGALDAVEFVGPTDDEQLGFHRVAKYYYYPACWEGTGMGAVIFNRQAWEALPPMYRAVAEAAANEMSIMSLARYDASNASALRRLVADGVQLRAFPRAVMDAGYETSWQYYREAAEKNPLFAKILADYSAFRSDVVTWFRVAEHSYDSFMYAKAAEQARRP
jgi:TRAP-type mannitol/chloroaromatic compound transport system substrate-binding protein